MPRQPAASDDPAVQEALRAYVKLLRSGKAIVARVEPRLSAHGLTVTQLGVLEAMAAGYVSSSYKDAVPFVVILLLLMFLPRGMFGAQAPERV